jgi:hypothetical protein
MDPRFLDLGTSWRWVVSFTSQPLYPGGRAPGTRCIGDWVSHSVGMDDVEKRKFLTLLRLELQPLGRPACSQSLYRLRYCGSLFDHRYLRKVWNALVRIASVPDEIRTESLPNMSLEQGFLISGSWTLKWSVDRLQGIREFGRKRKLHLYFH